jgi:2,4-dienoyl-CoA reductase-like NADH-dependent reductase (Old Yellow Enzyme family)
VHVSDPASGAGRIAKSQLFSPLSIRSVRLRNRIVASPMCQYHSVNGGPTDWQFVNFGKLAVGGAALVFGEETAIEAQGRKTYECAGLWCDDHIPQYRRMTAFIKAQGAIPAVQLGHSGAKGSCHGARFDWAPLTAESCSSGAPPWVCIAPSANESPRPWPQVREMDASDIALHMRHWREAALRAVDAGYEVAEIHGAHGYLIHQFLSPVTNRRSDAYGGTREGRMRFAFEITETVREAWPATLPLFFRVSAVDGKGGQWNLDDTVELAKGLRDRGVDVIDCSSGGISGTSAMPIVRRVPGYQVGFAERVRREAAVSTMAVGLITKAVQAEQILVSGQADLVALARELIWNPNWPVHAALELEGSDASCALLPPEQAHRLLRRETVSQLSINKTGAASSSEDDALTETT